nr:ribonuclease H-like domain-containing protein [Tanacetum cinerariifolium]
VVVFFHLRICCFLQKHFRKLCRLLLKQRGVRSTWGYPFAIACINIIFMLTQMLEFYQVKPKCEHCVNFVRILGEDEDSFDVLYCIAFAMMDAQWLATHALFVEFNEVLQAVRSQLEKELAIEDLARIRDFPAFNLLHNSFETRLLGKLEAKELSEVAYGFHIEDAPTRTVKDREEITGKSWQLRDDEFMAIKDETASVLKTFIVGLENLLSLKVKIIRCDNGTEFKNADLNQFCGLKGIKREFSVLRTPQQNGIAERKNKTLIEATRTLLADSLLPIPFWAEAVNTACYVQNKVLVTKPHNKTPYELLHGRLPSIRFMRPFGCHVTILNTLDP